MMVSGKTKANAYWKMGWERLLLFSERHIFWYNPQWKGNKESEKHYLTISLPSLVADCCWEKINFLLCRDSSLDLHNVTTSSFSGKGGELFLVAGIPTRRWVTALVHFHTMVHLVTTWWVAKSYIINSCNQQTLQQLIVLPPHSWQRIIVGTQERTVRGALLTRIERLQRVVQEWYKRGPRVVQKWYKSGTTSGTRVVNLQRVV